jgi:hypothetical protein
LEQLEQICCDHFEVKGFEYTTAINEGHGEQVAEAFLAEAERLGCVSNVNVQRPADDNT